LKATRVPVVGGAVRLAAVAAKVGEEIRAVLPPTIYFFVMLHVVALIRSLMLRGTGIALSTPWQIAVAALILGKAVLLADHLPLVNRYPEKPLAYNIAWKTVIYLLVATLIHYVERLVDFAREAGGLVAGNQRLLAETVWTRFWGVEILIALLIVVYVTMHELVRVLGRDRMLDMFFGRRPRPGVSSAARSAAR
jgi:hypothetical protein